MSESIVRKVQPFTIGTRLSVPAGSKCQDFTPNYLQNQSLDNCALQHNLNSLYLTHSQVCAHGPCLVTPIVKQVSLVKHCDDMAAEDHLNQNIASAAAVARSIKKITISGSKDRPENNIAKECVFPGSTKNNNNNNNVTSSSQQSLPRIVGVSCENKPNSQFKVLLRKENCDENRLAQGQTKTKVSEEQPIPQISSLESQPQWKDLVADAEVSPGVMPQSDCFTQRTSLFKQEALQAEAWIRGKLQDLKDGCNIQHCPLQDCEEASQTLQRDLKDFENTLIQLNQMGEQLICKMNPTSDLVKKQLTQLRDQWQTLKQTAAKQTRALGGAKNLQEFNTKVDKLEAWFKEKEEEQSLVNVRGESVDKMQLTRRILDLKQDEQLYRDLYEEINHLALKLEKQGKADGKNIASRRKHINKMYTWSFEMNWWLKVQSHLKNYHENLQLALEVSSFYHQADNILFAIQNIKKTIADSKELDKLEDQEIRDIAGQIMMFDVNVSQLSHLHPALAAGVIQKQSEVKESWTLLQKALRPALPCTSTTFSREDGDPLTSSWEQCNVGTELQRTMGKEVKEEQNRLKGYVGTADAGMGWTLSCQIQEQESANYHPSSPMGEVAVCANDVMTRHQFKTESRKPRAEEKPATIAQPGLGHPPLHIQLQKFTVSADKTLSWLKDNVSMATQVCSVASLEGLDAARRCQHALEQEILNNRARIEVVKREGRGLVRAQHPGSARIQEFLGQLEVLWDELRRRHQRNALFLQASEELGFRVVKLFQALGSLGAWLESVELSMKESSLAGDPETMSMAERQSCLLEREVAARGHELSVLRQEVDRLHCHSHPLTRGLPVRMEEVENKYQCVQRALTQQSSELQDTRMLTEFLERVELEESQEFSLGQPLHSEMSPAPTLMDADPLIESMGDPVEELREAVEMLNNTVRERGRSQNHDQAIRELLRKHTSLAVHVEECLCRSKDLGLDILEKETDMAVQCEPDRCGLETLWEKQDHLEIDYEVIREEVETVETQASRLQELCPERVDVFGAKIHGTLQAWAELRASVKENKSRLQEFVQLQDFFRSYLQLISWTEDTRSCIFSDTALHHGKDGQAPMAAELDLQIELKFEEFEELAATGRNILDKEHHLIQMVKERMEELRSMLGWISVHWRAQKQQWLHKNCKQESAQDNVYSIMCSSFTEPTACKQKVDQSVYPPVHFSEEERLLETPNSSQMFQSSSKETEDGYEIMKSIPSQSPDIVTPESPKSSIFVLKDKGSPGLGNTVNLILSFGNAGDSQVQVLDTPVNDDDVQEETTESVCRVSTYLHVKDNNLATGPVYESITLPRQKSYSTTSNSPPPPSSSPLATAPLTPSVNFYSGSTSIFSSLKRISKKRKRKIDTRRHTIQKIMGVEERADEIPHRPSETIIYDTRTWPLKEGKKKKSKSPANIPKAYMKNPLVQDIETECTGEYSINPYAVSKGSCLMTSSNNNKSHCRFLSLGSVLSFDLPKDMTVIPSIQDIITIAPPESKTANGTDPDPLSQRQTALSSFKQTRPMLVAAESASAEKYMLNNDCTLKQQFPPNLNNDQDGKCSNKLQVKCSSSVSLKDDADQQVKSQSIHVPIYVNQPPTTTVHKHECLSVHTLINDLNGHKYHKCARAQNGQSQASQMVVNLKSTVNVSVRQDSMDSGISSSGSVKLSSDERTQPKGVVGKLISLDVGCITTDTKSNETNLVSSTSLSELATDNVHVDHQQFEEEEEELEGIWGQNLRNSICSDIMYQNSQEETSLDQSMEHVSRSPSPKTTPTLFRNLVTASAPNLLVAEFRLPPSVQSLLGYDKDQTLKHHPSPLAVGDRRSWAAFPNREASSGASVAVNETAADPVKLPEIMDNHRYIYHYREDEEEDEEEEEAEVGEEEHTRASKDPSLSLQFVHMGLKSDPKFSPVSQDMNMQDESTGGRCITLCGKPELQTMEGTLERKQRLQLGGKKAASRGWSSYHAVLYRHTLCFYQDRKDTLRSSVCGLPLNLIGAECVPAPEYTKKPNSFHLRLRDGSEYLLNASSRFMMKKWIMKIQANTGHSDLSSGIYRDKDPTYPLKPLYCSGCPGLATCLCSSQHEVTSTFPRLKPRGVTRASEITVLSREFSHMSHSHLGSVEEQQDASAEGGCDDDGDSLNLTVTQSLSGASTDSTSPLSQSSSGQDWLSSQHRSHSFTSATYQKISPLLSSPGVRGVEKGSNYCVTLLVGDKSRDVPSINHTQASMTEGAQESALRQYTSLPRPRNKSVFKKFFGKRD